jgi:hypothetical protein
MPLSTREIEMVWGRGKTLLPKPRVMMERKGKIHAPGGYGEKI